MPSIAIELPSGTVLASVADLPTPSAANVGLTLAVAGNPVTRWRVTQVGTDTYRWEQY